MSTVLRSVLGAGGSQTERGQDRKLLELPDLDGNDTPHSMDTSQADGEGGEGAEAAGPSAEAIASVVTQAPPAGVPNSPRTGAAPRPAPPIAAIVPAGGHAAALSVEDEEGSEVRSSWRNKFRCVCAGRGRRGRRGRIVSTHWAARASHHHPSPHTPGAQEHLLLPGPRCA